MSIRTHNNVSLGSRRDEGHIITLSHCKNVIWHKMYIHRKIKRIAGLTTLFIMKCIVSIGQRLLFFVKNVTPCGRFRERYDGKLSSPSWDRAKPNRTRPWRNLIILSTDSVIAQWCGEYQPKYLYLCFLM